MEVDFDKEIDAILRRARAGAPVLAGETASPHLDADELSAFAENAMPESAKRLYTLHLAECDRCRKILSEIILMNAEAEPALAASAAPAVVESGIPWYRRLFLFPNLAYVMGALVLVFSGFLGYTVLQNGGAESAATYDQISQQTQEDQTGGGGGGGGPSYEEPMYPAAAANTASNAAVSAANTNAAVVPNTAANTAAAPMDADKLARRDEVAALEKATPTTGQGVTADGLALSPAPAPAAPMAAPAKPTANETTTDTVAEKKEAEQVTAESAISQRSMADLPTVNRQSAKRSAGPLRNQQNQFPNRAENQYAVPPTRTVGGRKFEQKEGVWYDTAYNSGQATTNIRRGTDAFNDLDSGLRSIANSLTGTVVVVWKGKAYRIQ